MDRTIRIYPQTQIAEMQNEASAKAAAVHLVRPAIHGGPAPGAPILLLGQAHLELLLLPLGAHLLHHSCCCRIPLLWRQHPLPWVIPRANLHLPQGLSAKASHDKGG